MRRARLDLEVALYQLQIADALIPFQVESEDSEEIYFRNAGQARNRGLELSLSAVPHPGLRTTIAYTFGDYVFEDYEVEDAGTDLFSSLATRCRVCRATGFSPR